MIDISLFGEDENLHSPSGSEDSVEVQISPISLRNKRKLAEPKKALKSDPNRPLKKRRLIERSSSPFRPWNSPEKQEEDRWRIEEERRREEEVQRLYEAQIHAQVLARLQIAAKSQELNQDSRFRTANSHQDPISRTATPHPEAGLRADSQSTEDFRAASLQSAISLNKYGLHTEDKIRTAGLSSESRLRTATQHPEAGLREAPQSKEDFRTANLHQEAISRTATPHLDSKFRTEAILQSEINLNKSNLPSEDKIRTTNLQSESRLRTATPYPENNLHTSTFQSEGRFRAATFDLEGNVRTADPHQDSNYRPGALNSDPRFLQEVKIRTDTLQKRSHSLNYRLQDSAHQNEPLALVLREGRVPPHPGVSDLPYEDKRGGKIPSSRMSSTSGAHSEQSGTNHSQRNYKNMTRERRIEANARERTRVHTISAAFNTLRRSIPAYSHNQKLSKLSVLRIACSYIMTLSKIVREGEDSGVEGVNGAELGECVDLVSRTIQTEGKLRKKKDE
ncbi:Similar to Atoh8: Protein atonal homolog 8 (Mus musculus) [Cotesia congregata]|uniref:Similar to Atoh8: Protein atonal homolog 8 (Mus musculus) n=1 Tax=Cotesia congregata TaxID=51543 RepID=A0A8J2H6J0_COTCN|nr:Similar to Atoh8: Protein atonal homolog 8 (Mus musculus) [Cotesia congregata]